MVTKTKKSKHVLEKEDDPDALAHSINNNRKINLMTSKLKLKMIKTRFAVEDDAGSPTSQDSGSPDFHHFNKSKDIKRKGFPPGFHNEQRSGMMKLASMSEGGKYAKYYLLDAQNINGNGWGVVSNTLEENIKTFIDKPFVITARDWIPNSPYENQYDHPFIGTNYIPLILKHQEAFRVGNIVKVAKDENDLWFAMIAIDEKFRGMPLPPFCSPAIYQLNPHEPEGDISQWLGLHLAGLMDNPAYGARIAILRGMCTGDAGTCSHQFRMGKQQISALISSTNEAVNKVNILNKTQGKQDICECPIESKKKELRSKLNKHMTLSQKIAQLKKKRKQTNTSYGQLVTTTIEPKTSQELRTEGIEDEEDIKKLAALGEMDDLNTLQPVDNVTDIFDSPTPQQVKSIDQEVDIIPEKEDDKVFKKLESKLQDDVDIQTLNAKVKIQILKTLEKINGADK